jgi:hypothetical protein
MGAGARRSQDRYGARGREKAMEVGATTTGGRRRRNGVNPASDCPIYRGVHRIYPLRFLPLCNAPQRLYPEKFARRLRWNFHQHVTATT